MANFNQKQADHLQALINNVTVDGKKLQKGYLAEVAGVSRQSVSNWLKGSQMKDEHAEKIHQKWPHYSKEWILGYSDFVNDDVKLWSLFKSNNDRNKCLKNVLIWYMRFNDFEPLNLKDDESLGLWEREFEAGNYKISHNGKSVVLTDKQCIALANEVNEIVVMRLNSILKRGWW